jgi:hypothetical protein
MQSEFASRLEQPIAQAIRKCKPGSSRHLVLVEAARLAYRRQAMAADAADKARFSKPEA